MNDSLKKLLTYIEPKILNIQDKRVEILSLGDSYKTLKEIVDLGQNSYRDILEFYDQDFIIRCIKISNDNYINNLVYRQTKLLKYCQFLLFMRFDILCPLNIAICCICKIT